jgi:hypothetical protein
MAAGDTGLRTLRVHARDLGVTSLARVPRTIVRVCYICINTNRAFRLGIGTAPILRAIKVAQLFKSFGYDVFFMANPHCCAFREYISLFLQRTTEHLFFVYIGQGGEPGPESLIFDDEPMEDAEVGQIFAGNRSNTVKLTVMADFCVEGAIFQNLELFGTKTVVISCAGTDSQMEEGAEVFIEHFVRELTNRNELTNQQLFDALRIVIKRHGLTLSVDADPKPLIKDVVATCKPIIERNQLIR